MTRTGSTWSKRGSQIILFSVLLLTATEARLSVKENICGPGGQYLDCKSLPIRMPLVSWLRLMLISKISCNVVLK